MCSFQSLMTRLTWVSSLRPNIAEIKLIIIVWLTITTSNNGSRLFELMHITPDKTKELSKRCYFLFPLVSTMHPKNFPAFLQIWCTVSRVNTMRAGRFLVKTPIASFFLKSINSKQTVVNQHLKQNLPGIIKLIFS